MYSGFFRGSFHVVLFFLVFSLFLPHSARADNEGFDLDIGRYSLSFTPKILEDGIQNDFSFGLFYSDAMKMAAEVRMRHTKGAANDTIWGIADSLVTRERQIYEFFLLPLNYHFLRIAGFSLRAGAGMYYEYNKLNENGFFNDSIFYDPPGDDHYNAYTNDFSGHAVGPLLDVGMSYSNRVFFSAFSFGLVPVFQLNRKQTWKLSPMMNPDPTYSVSSESTCGPYYYLHWDIALRFKYFSLFFSLLNERSNLHFTAAGFDNITGAWADVQETVRYTATAFEISLLVYLGRSGFMPQIGYGRTVDKVTGGSNYLLLGVKKAWF